MYYGNDNYLMSERILERCHRSWLEPDDDDEYVEMCKCVCCGHESEYEYDYYDKELDGYVCETCIEEAVTYWWSLEPEEIDEVTCSYCGKKTGKRFVNYMDEDICLDCFAQRIEGFEVKKEWE